MAYDPKRKKYPASNRPRREDAPRSGAPRALDAAARQSVREERPAEEEALPGTSLVYGKNAVTELLKSGAGVDTVFVADSMAEQVAAYYTALAKEAGAVVKRVHSTKLRGMTGWAPAYTFEQGLAATIEFLRQNLDRYKPDQYNI